MTSDSPSTDAAVDQAVARLAEADVKVAAGDSRDARTLDAVLEAGEALHRTLVARLSDIRS